MTGDEMEMLIGYGEDSRIEYKKELRLTTLWHRVEFVKDMMALANGHDRSPAYLLVGVGDGGDLHDVGDGVPDEAVLQQLVASLIDPPVLFSLGHYTIQEVRLALVTIPPSRERFHVASRDVHEPGGKSLLRKGEIWIRRGTAKMPPQALDFKMLKESYAQERVPQAVLDVTFLAEERTISTHRSRLRPSQSALRLVTHLIIPPFTGRLGGRYQFVPLRFFVHNRGQHQAESVVIELDFPDDCQVVASFPDDRNPHGWHTSVIRRYNRVRIEGERLVHGDFRWSHDVYVRFLRRDRSYLLKWTARAGNIAVPATGVLRIETSG